MAGDSAARALDHFNLEARNLLSGTKVTMHAILVLPALAWLLSFVRWSERRRLGVVLLAAAGYIVLAGVVAVGNVIGLAPAQMPIAMIAVVVLGAFALLAAGVVVLSGVARSSKPAA